MGHMEPPSKKQCVATGPDGGRTPTSNALMAAAKSAPVTSKADAHKRQLLLSTTPPPKEPPDSAVPSSEVQEEEEVCNLQQYHCDACKRDISHVFRVRCAKCVDFDLCVPCFCAGPQTSNHLNTHPYIPIGRNDFPLFSPDWTADEEMMLLEGVSKFGFGNWSEIANLVAPFSTTGQPKRKRECETHYYDIHVTPYQVKQEIQTWPPPDPSLTPAEAKERYKQARRELHERILGRYHAPPQATTPSLGLGGLSSTSSCNVVGYMPLRGDFDVEYDNDAELLLSDIEFRGDETPQERELKLKVLDVYNAKLDQRVVRKRVVIERGLANWRRIQQEDRRRPKEEADLYALFRLLARYDMSPDWEQLIQLILSERRLRERLTLLQEWKALKLQTFEEIEKHEAAKMCTVSGITAKQRSHMLQQVRHRLSTASTDKSHTRKGHNEPVPTPEDAVAQASLAATSGYSTSVVTPGLEGPASSYPGGNLLTEAELDFCDRLQLPPFCFLVVKHTLLRATAEMSDPHRLQKTETLRMDASKSGQVFDFILHAKFPAFGSASALEASRSTTARSKAAAGLRDTQEVQDEPMTPSADTAPTDKDTTNQ